MKCKACRETFEFPVYRKRQVTLIISPPYTEKGIPGETYQRASVEDMYFPCCPFCRTPIYKKTGEEK